ncbi:oxygenase MpaB family protein [Nocardioides sp.]|uniref:oxygenase MpaB family protein n=1 Tax=Nocardioides sp. TaxID=35761 RepID=UPI002BBFC417|nr:oxygenase MpaB family protein [Nocardioides sp.]HSX67934.1 oxygenase MpaB family protein [Nocardioides sp.]
MPFGPGSLLYESYGDRAGFLFAPATGLMQLMYPALGKGVEEHSAFYEEPFERLVRSVPQILGMIFDGDTADEQAHRVRDFHRDIKGVMPSGERYHALDPATFFWAHATFVDVAFRVDDLVARRMSRTVREAYYAETVDWWRMYGMTMRVVPRSYGDFLEYWDHHVENVLEVTPAAQGLIDFLNQPWRMEQPWLPAPLWKVGSRLGGLPARDVAVGCLPAVLRERCGFAWGPVQAAGHAAFMTSVRLTWPRLPEAVRLLPRARAAYRQQGRTGFEAAIARVSDTRVA